VVKKEIVRAVLDNNAWNDIVARDTSGQMLAKLQQGVARGSVSILVPPAVIEETLAFAQTDGVATRKRLAYVRAFGHSLLLRDVGDMVRMEARGEPTNGNLFMLREDADSLFALTLAASDDHSDFVAPADGKTYRASDVIRDTKKTERDRSRSVDTGAEMEIVSRWKSERSKTVYSDPELEDDLGLTAKAAPEQVLRAYGEIMTQRAGSTFPAWVQQILVKLGAPESIITDSPAHHPFVSAHVAYEYAHLERHLKDGKLWAHGDWYDQQYCVLSVAADVLVTSDADLRRTCQLMPFQPFRVLSTQEFIENYT